MRKNTGALVNVDFDEVRKLPEGAVYEDVQGNRYLVFHDCASSKATIVDKFIPFYLEHLEELVGPERALTINDDPPFITGDELPDNLADCPPELIDEDWFMTTFKDGVSVDDGDAVVRFNELVDR